MKNHWFQWLLSKPFIQWQLWPWNHTFFTRKWNKRPEIPNLREFITLSFDILNYLNKTKSEINVQRTLHGIPAHETPVLAVNLVLLQFALSCEEWVTIVHFCQNHWKPLVPNVRVVHWLETWKKYSGKIKTWKNSLKVKNPDKHILKC